MPGPVTRLLLLRPKAQSRRFAAQVRARFGDRVDVVQAPLQDIRFLPVDLPDPRPGALILSSENGVVAAAGIAALSGLPVFCVGERTALLAQRAGFRVLGRFATADDLVSGILKDRSQWPAAPAMHLRGTHARGDIAGRLSDAGLTCWEIIAYDQIDLPADAVLTDLLARSEPIVAMLFSPRSARLFAAAMDEARPNILVIALSRAVADAYDGPSPRGLRIAGAPTGEAMLVALAKELDSGARG